MSGSVGNVSSGGGTVSKSQLLNALREDQKALRAAFEEERNQNATLKAWIRDQLRPGIRNLKDALFQRLAVVEEELEQERKRRESLEKWIESSIGRDLGQIRALIDQEVKKSNSGSGSQSSTTTRSNPSSSGWSAPSRRSGTFDSQSNQSSFVSPPVHPSSVETKKPSTSASKGSNSSGGTGSLANNPFMQHAHKTTSSGNTSSRFVRPQSTHQNVSHVNQAPPSKKEPEKVESTVSKNSSSSEGNIHQWLKNIGMDRYEANFTQNGFTQLSQLSGMTKADLGDIGIKMLGHKKAILLAIAEIPQSGSSSMKSHTSATTTTTQSKTDNNFWGVSKSSENTGSLSTSTRSSRPKTMYAATPTTSSTVGGSLEDLVRSVKNDYTSSNWAILEYDHRGNKVFPANEGSGGFDEFVANLDDGKVQFGLLRLEDGDRESRRIKFVFVTWCGPSTNGIVKARSNTHKRDVVRAVGQFHVEIRAEEQSDLDLPSIQRKLKKAGGADYDTGSNATGYVSNAKSIREKALANLRRTDNPENARAFVFEKHALPKSTPCDLSGRKFVAPPSEAQANIDMQGGLDVGKWQQ